MILLIDLHIIYTLHLYIMSSVFKVVKHFFLSQHFVHGWYKVCCVCIILCTLYCMCIYNYCVCVYSAVYVCVCMCSCTMYMVCECTICVCMFVMCV